MFNLRGISAIAVALLTVVVSPSRAEEETSLSYESMFVIEALSFGGEWPLQPAGAFDDVLFMFESEAESKLRTYMTATISTLDTRVRTTLPKVLGLDRQLLALKYYLARSRREIRSKWAWTPAQANRFRKSAEFTKMVAEIEKLRTKFREMNPGYDLRVKLDIRTVAEQVASWNETASVGAAARALLASCTRQIDDTVYVLPPIANALTRFRQLLTRFRSPVVPTVAAPGLSQHGQLRAFDFVIVQGDRVIAGTETGSIKSVWDRPGWSAKLKEAVKQSGAKFEGPLQVPREPWHYSYRP